MKRTSQILGSLVVAGILLFGVFRHFDVRGTMRAMQQARPLLLAIGFGLMVTGYLLRGARWQIWERSLRYQDSLSLILIGFMGNNILPARLGELLRAHCTSARTSYSRGRTAALASVAAERILDGFVLAVIGLAGAASIPLNARLRWSFGMVAGLFAALACVLIVSIRFQGWIRSLIAATNRKFPGHLTSFAQGRANQFLDGFMPLGTIPRTCGALAMTAVIWTVEIGCYYCIGLAVWSGMGLRTAVVLLAVVNFASLIPLTMGGIGTIEAAGVAFLTSFGMASPIALAIVLLQHGAQYAFTSISGGIAYLAGGFWRVSLADPKGVKTEAATMVSPSLVLEETRSHLNRLSEVVELKPASRDEITLSIVIPAYNEQSRLPRTVLETIRWCTSQQIQFELIVSDDGSRDETLALARLFEESDGRVRALACPHMGKGSAVRMGVLNAKGRYVLFMDADGATPLAELPKLMTAMESFDVAIGSRVVQHPGEVEVRTSFHRRIIGRGFAFFVNLFAIEGIADTQCGFKMFRRDAAWAIFSRQKTGGFAFDVEILFLARRLALSICEIPVNWQAQPGSKVNLFSDSIRMLWDITHIRWRHRKLDTASSRARAAGSQVVNSA